MEIIDRNQKVAISIPIIILTIPIPIPVFGIFMFLFPWDSHSHAHLYNLRVSVCTSLARRQLADVVIPQRTAPTFLCIMHYKTWLYTVRSSSVA